MLMTFDVNMKPLPVSVRVGQAVDTIGQAGRPKTITGFQVCGLVTFILRFFQTHTTPVLLGFGDRAELATEDCILCLHTSLFSFIHNRHSCHFSVGRICNSEAESQCSSKKRRRPEKEIDLGFLYPT
jgi:hypothetical protein